VCSDYIQSFQQSGGGNSATKTMARESQVPLGGAIMAYKGGGKKAKIQSSTGKRTDYNKGRPNNGGQPNYTRPRTDNTSPHNNGLKSNKKYKPAIWFK